MGLFVADKPTKNQGLTTKVKKPSAMIGKLILHIEKNKTKGTS